MTSRAPHISTLILLTAVSTLSLNMFLPALPAIAKDLSAPVTVIILAASGYLALTAFVQLLVGPLSDRIGRRPVLLVALVIFSGASLFCALAEDVTTFLIARLCQGAVITGFVLAMAIVRDTRNEADSVSLIGYITAAMALAPMIGPMVGGALDTLLGWRAIFWLYGAAGIGLFALCWKDLTETAPKTTTHPFSALGLFKNKHFLAYAGCTAFSTSTFYIFVTGTPLVAPQTFGMTSAQLGLGIGSITTGFMFGSFLSGRLANEVDTLSLILAGRLAASLGLSGGILLSLTGHLSAVLFFTSTLFVGLGNGLTMPGANAKAMSVGPTQTGGAAGLSGALTVLVGAVLTWGTGQFLDSSNGVTILLVMMLATAALSLSSALWAKRLTALASE